MLDPSSRSLTEALYAADVRGSTGARAGVQVRPRRATTTAVRSPELFAAVAEERDGIATEPPVDLDARAASWRLESIFVADRR